MRGAQRRDASLRWWRDVHQPPGKHFLHHAYLHSALERREARTRTPGCRRACQTESSFEGRAYCASDNMTIDCDAYDDGNNENNSCNDDF
jgi:hypothetical protein